MKTINTYAGDLRLVGGRLGLDFVNTVNDHSLAQPKDHWHNYAMLLAWARHAHACTPTQADAAAQAALQQPAAAQATLDLARVARRALYGLFSAAGTGRAPATADADTLNAVLACLPTPQLAAAETGIEWSWPPVANPLEVPIWPSLLSASALLASPECALVRECAGQGCGWLFLDTSRTRSRRWCSMEDCGNIAKARRHYARRAQPDA